MGAQILEVRDDWDWNSFFTPLDLFQPRSGIFACGEDLGLAGGQLGAHVREASMGHLIGQHEPVLMVLSSAQYKDVVCKHSGYCCH